MSVFLRFASTVSNILRCSTAQLLMARSTFHSLADTTMPVALNPGGLFNIAVRYNIRNHFPRPCERKRIRRHGWAKRMSTAGGQRVLMRRILKGKHVYSH